MSLDLEPDDEHHLAEAAAEAGFGDDVRGYLAYLVDKDRARASRFDAEAVLERLEKFRGMLGTGNDLQQLLADRRLGAL